MVTIPVSVGELIDKLSILHVKKIKIVNESKLSFINNEFELIYKLITDVHNRDLEIELDEVLSSIILLFQDSWIIKILMD